jgi:phosphoenolpyruvate synthase/pyruvate phosphate dikinase
MDKLKQLEQHFKDALDIEFTIEDGKLYILQVRSVKRSAIAMIHIAVGLVKTGLLKAPEALQLVDPVRINTELMKEILDPKDKKKHVLLAKGLAASAGGGVGRAVFDSKTAEDWKKKGERVILIRPMTEPEDLGGMAASEGILTSEGGRTSHAAVVAAGMGKPAVVGTGAMRVDVKEKQAHFPLSDGKTLTIHEGGWVSIDGTTGEVLEGQVKTIPSEIRQVFDGQLAAEDSPLYQDFSTVFQWAKDIAKANGKSVWTNAETESDLTDALRRGAEGIALARTEHMFRDQKNAKGETVQARLLPVQTMFLAPEGSAIRNATIEKIGEMQREDFIQILQQLKGLPATIRFLDPPMDEFLPRADDQEKLEPLALELGVSVEEVAHRIESQVETNPMMGKRGVRLLMANPSIFKMQAEAMLEAYRTVKATGATPKLKMMLPNVTKVQELIESKKLIQNLIREKGLEEDYEAHLIQMGTMIEIPAAVETADQMAQESDFFSFGTNDLTQAQLLMSRNDTGPIVAKWEEIGAFAVDPTQQLDSLTVLPAIQRAVQRGRMVDPALNIGVCGAHGSEPKSIKLFIKAGLDYVGSTPHEVPAAWISVAQAVREMEKEKKSPSSSAKTSFFDWKKIAGVAGLMLAILVLWPAVPVLLGGGSAAIASIVGTSSALAPGVSIVPLLGQILTSLSVLGVGLGTVYVKGQKKSAAQRSVEAAGRVIARKMKGSVPISTPLELHEEQEGVLLLAGFPPVVVLGLETLTKTMVADAPEEMKDKILSEALQGMKGMKRPTEGRVWGLSATLLSQAMIPGKDIPSEFPDIAHLTVLVGDLPADIKAAETTASEFLKRSEGVAGNASVNIVVDLVPVNIAARAEAVQIAGRLLSSPAGAEIRVSSPLKFMGDSRVLDILAIRNYFKEQTETLSRGSALGLPQDVDVENPNLLKDLLKDFNLTVFILGYLVPLTRDLIKNVDILAERILRAMA